MTKSKILIWVGIVTMFAIGLVHGIDAPDSFNDAAYKGWLFYANALGSVIVAWGLFRKLPWSWNLGLMIAGGSMVGYVISRTVGLPQIPAEPDAWFEPLGVVAMLSEALFITVFILRKNEK